MERGATAQEGRWTVGPVPESLPDAVHRSFLVEASHQAGLFRLATVGRFFVRPGGPVTVEPAAGASDQDVECLLRGPVAALRCCLHGHLVIHGTAVEIGGRALVTCGSARGNSSLAAALALAGHRTVADGVVVLSGDPLCASSPPDAWPPRLTLWPETVKALGLDPSAGEPLRPSLVSRSFSLGPAPSRAPVPLGALAILGIEDFRPAVPPLVTKTTLRLADTIRTLLRAQWHPNVLRDLGLQAKHFTSVLAAVASGPHVVFRLTPNPMRETLATLVAKAEETLG